MDDPLKFVFFALSAILLALYAGAFTALELLSVRGSDSGEDTDGSARLGILLSDPASSGIALAVARAVCSLATVITALRVVEGTRLAGPGHVGTGVVIAASLLLATTVGSLLAHRGAERFLGIFRAFLVPVVVLMRPLASVVLKDGSPRGGLARAISYPVIPLKNKIEIAGETSRGAADEEQRIMSSIMEFGETRVREVMVPRIDVVALNLAMNRDEAYDTVVDAGHSRIPVYDDSIDRIVGVLYTKDLLHKIIEGDDVQISKLVREPFFVPESKMIDELIGEFKSRKQHLAIVVDEYGGTAGIVTLEDILEEIVGDIQDEFDTEAVLVRRIDDDSAVCLAKVHVDELNKTLGLNLPEETADSLGGLLYHVIGQVPRVGDEWEDGPLRFVIESVERQRIDRVAIHGLTALSRATEGTGD